MSLGRYTGDVFKVVACPCDSGHGGVVCIKQKQGIGATKRESQGTFAQKINN